MYFDSAKTSLRHNVLVLLVLLAFAPGCATTAPMDMDMDEAYAAATDLLNLGELNSRQKARAFRILESCSEQRHGGCAETLGWSYYNGDLGHQSLECSEHWLKVAASTEGDFGFAGIAGYLSLAEIYCGNAEFEKRPEEIANVLSESEELSGIFREFLQTDTWKFEELCADTKFINAISAVREMTLATEALN